MSLSAYLIKHLQGQHDQLSHGRRGSNISESRVSQDSIIDLFANADSIGSKFKKQNIVKNEITLTNGFKTAEEQNKVQRSIEDTYNHIMDSHDGIPAVALFLKNHPVDNIRVSAENNITGLASNYPEIFGADVSRFKDTTGAFCEYIGYSSSGKKIENKNDIVFSAGKEKNWDEIDIIDKGGDKSNTILGESARTIFRHELGHHVYHNMTIKSEKSRKKLSSLWYQHLEKNKFTTEFIKKKISAYAGTNASECFSECFALYTHPDYKSGKNRLPKEIENFFNEHLPYRVEKSLSEYFVEVKHLQGQHDQTSHGRRGSNINESRSDSNIENYNASVEKAKQLNNEWSKKHKEHEGPFWDTTGEKNGKYWMARDNKNELLAGATTIQKGLSTEILSIASHSKGMGKKILDKIKRENIWIIALASSDKSKKWFIKNGFREVLDEPGQHNVKWRNTKSLSKYLVEVKASGNFGHVGRSGQVGGSAPKGQSSNSKNDNYLFCGWKKDAKNKAKAFGRECNQRPEKFLKENTANAILARNGLNEYVNYGHQEINSLLRKGDFNKDNPTRTEEIIKAVNGLDKLMDNCSTPKNVTVVRQVSKEFYERLQEKVGKHFIDKGFVSTTLTPKVLFPEKDKSKNNHITIKVPKGTKAFFVDSKYRKGKNEFELLLNRGLKYQINKSKDGIELEIINGK